MEYANHLKEYAPAWSASQVDEEVARIRKAAEARNHNTEVYKFCYSAIDLTTLSCNDSVKSVTEFARKAAEFYQKYPHIPNVASICIYPSFVETVGLAVDGTPMKITSVGGGFPAAQTFLEVKALEVAMAVENGADEVDKNFNGIKGGGGALYREKVVASMAKEVIWIMDESKLVDKIGAFHLPVEIAQYGSKQAMERMAAYGWNPVLRVRDGKTFVTDNGNFIADLHLGAGFDIQDVYSKLTGMLGVLEHGLFLNMCKRMIVGHSNGEVQVIENPSK